MVKRIGVTGVVTEGGGVKPDDSIVAELPELPHKSLEFIW